MDSGREAEKHQAATPKGRVRFGDLRRLTPMAPRFGFERGTPVDRYYIEAFLDRQALAIHGRVVEFGGRDYTRRFGGARVSQSVVWQAPASPDPGDIAADLANAAHVDSDSFDCVVCTQTLQLLFDVAGAVRTLHRVLAPGGVALVTVPGISQIDDPQWSSAWCWAFTPTSMRRLFADAFGEANVEVTTHGNVLTSVAFLHGLSADELESHERDHVDPMYPMLITIRATKPLSASAEADMISARVSVVIPCFNQAPFLGEAIESALNQTGPAVEVVVVDDGSPDNAREVASRYPGVVLVAQSNRGLAAARNRGIESSTGDYLVFLDSDDRLMPGALAEGLRHLQAHSEWGLVAGHHRTIDAGGTPLHEWHQPPPESDRYKSLLQRNDISMGASAMFRRDVFGAVGMFDTELMAAEDYDLYLRVARRFPIGSHDVVVAEYRRHGAAMTDDPFRMFEAMVRVMRKQDPFTRDRPDYFHAQLAGLDHWREFYGTPAAKQLAEAIRGQRPLAGVLRSLGRVAVISPHEAWRLVRSAFRS